MTMQQNSLERWQGACVDAWQHISSEHGSGGVSIHLCKKLSFTDPTDTMFIMKNTPYVVKSKSTHTIKLLAKTAPQINTQYLALQMLAHSKFIVTLHAIVQEEQNQDFFYSFLGNVECQGIRNVCLVLDYCEGGTLQRAILQSLPQQLIVKYACEILQGIEAMQRVGIIHRDLRSSNVMIKKGRAVIIDFDTAFIEGVNQIPYYGTNTIVPELMREGSSQNKVDLYSLGAIIYQMMTHQEYKYPIKQCIGYAPSLITLKDELLHPDPSLRCTLERAKQLLQNMCPQFATQPQQEANMGSLRTISSNQPQPAQSQQSEETLSLSFGLEQCQYEVFLPKKKDKMKAMSHEPSQQKISVFKKKHCTNDVVNKQLNIHCKQNQHPF